MLKHLIHTTFAMHLQLTHTKHALIMFCFLENQLQSIFFPFLQRMYLSSQTHWRSLDTNLMRVSSHILWREGRGNG